MAIDVLMVNSPVVDLRGPYFRFARDLAGPGGLCVGAADDRPDYNEQQYQEWIDNGQAVVGGVGNAAPLMSRAGLDVAVAAYLGAGPSDGYDAAGRFILDVLTKNRIRTSCIQPHPELPTGVTFIYEAPDNERGGLAYFPGANNDFDFNRFRDCVTALEPRIVYYMYSGLSERGDANGGRDLADYLAWCRSQGALVIADSHTLTDNPGERIARGERVAAYRLLEPLLPVLDIFFTSSDEAAMIVNTLADDHDPVRERVREGDNAAALAFLCRQAADAAPGRPRLFGITVPDGAWTILCRPNADDIGPTHVRSRFLCGDVVDLVGAGDSFRSGVVSYLARHTDAFRDGTLDMEEAVQMGNLFASLYIKAPLDRRYDHIRPFEKLLAAVQSGRDATSFEALMETIESS